MTLLLSRSGGNKGFTLVETVLAIGILSFAAAMGSRTLLDSARGVHRIRFQKKASALAEMVFQQYTAYTAQNYQLLAVYNATRQAPKTFFNRPDNFGYDGIVITTLATYSENRSSCTVSVALTWQDGGSPKTSTYIKTFAPGSQLSPGAVLQVWVKAPCPQGTTQQSIISSCPGLPGLKLVAPSSSGGTDVVGTTDSDGQVLLKNVILGDNVQVQITAPTLADFTDATSTPGYYAIDGGGNYLLTVTKAASLNLANLNTLLVTDFQPMGQITGQLVNDDTGVANAPVAGMTVVLGNGTAGGFVALAGSIYSCSNNTNCSVVTDSNGRFTFNNVVPTALSVTALGRPGSDPTIQPGDPQFVWGYTNPNPYPAATSDWTNAAQHAANKGPIIQSTVHIQRLGWMVLHVFNKLNNQPISGLIMHLSYPATPWNANSSSNKLIPPADSGVETLYNVFASNSAQFYADAGRSAQSGDYGYFTQATLTCPANCVGQAVDVMFPVAPLYQLNGQIIDDHSPSVIDKTVISQWVPWGYITDSLTASGLVSTQMIPPTRTNPTDTVPYTIGLWNPTVQLPGTLIGNIVDRDTNGPVMHTQIEILDGVYEPVTTSDANGFFTYTSTFPYGAPLNANVACNDNTLQCIMCPTGMSCTGSGAPVHINSGTDNTTTLRKWGSHGYLFSDLHVPLQSAPAGPYITISCWLSDVNIGGSVTDTSGNLLSGITVYGGPALNPITVGGNYAGQFFVFGRNSNSLGYTILFTQAQTIGGVTYGADPGTTIPIPALVDPTGSLSSNIVLPIIPGGGSASGM